MSSGAPGYSPALSTPSSAGAAGACWIVVFGSTDMLTFSLPGPRVEFVVVTVIIGCWAGPGGGCVVWLLVTWNVTVRVARPARAARTASTSRWS